MNYVWNVLGMARKRNAQRALVGKDEGNRTLG
jgi:hypothetical protein